MRQPGNNDLVRKTFWLCLGAIFLFFLLCIGNWVFSGDFQIPTKAVPIVQQTPITVYYTHLADFQRYSVNDPFMEFAGSEPSGVVTLETDPMYAGSKSLMKTTQSGYMYYARWKDIKPTQCWVQYNEIIRFPTTAGFSYPFLTWQGINSTNESYPHITLVTSGGNLYIHVRERSNSTPILSLDCGPKTTFPHKVSVQWSSSWVILQFDSLYQEMAIPVSWTVWPCNSSRFSIGSGVFLRHHQMTLFGPQVTGISQ